MIAPSVIDDAAKLLLAGQLVAFPTETVYGLGADAASEAAMRALYRLKGRPADHPVIVHVSGARAAEAWAELPSPARSLIEAFWPGPLTVVLPRRPRAPGWACGGQATIGLRSPSHPVAHALMVAFEQLGGLGIAAPSANRFGRVSPTRADHVLDDLGDEVPLILDGGPTEVGVESTIVDLSRGRPVLLRPGGVSAARIEAVLGAPIEWSANALDPASVDLSAPRASGTLASHYAPRTPLALIEFGQLAPLLEQQAREGRSVAVWLSPEDRTRLERGHPGAGHGHHLRADAPSRPELYARQLYAVMRDLDAQGRARILIVAPPRAPAWRAVWDRLSRAATRP